MGAFNLGFLPLPALGGVPELFVQFFRAGELEALAQRMGLLPFFACGIPGFSIEEFAPNHFWFTEGVDGLWEWRMDVARRGAVAYGKLFHNKAGMVSREWNPDLANYRRDGCDFDAHYEEGLAGYKEKCIIHGISLFRNICWCQ